MNITKKIKSDMWVILYEMPQYVADNSADQKIKFLSMHLVFFFSVYSFKFIKIRRTTLAC